MPFFRYQARGPDGAYLEGTIEAPSPGEAKQALAVRGLKAHTLTDVPFSAPQSAPVSSVRAQVSHRQISQSIVKTRWGTDKDIHLLFAQLASYLRAGINPAQAFGNLSRNSMRSDYQAALEEASRSGVEGRSVADTLRQYPYLFPEHVVGIYAAGEAGGFLPEACDTISGQADSARKFGRPFVWLSWFTLMTLLCAPLGLWVVHAAIETMDIQERAGGTAPGFPTLFRAMFDKLIWPFGPAILIAWAVAIPLWKGWKSLQNTRRRHALSARLPLAGKRGWYEGDALFAWTLSHLLKAAVPPKRAVMQAADAIPNRAIRDQIYGAGNQMADNTPISQAIGTLKMMPAEFRPMISTGEMTGDVPGQLLIAAKGSRDEQTAIEGQSKYRIGCWALLLMALGFLFVAWLLYGVMYGNIFDRINSWQD